jgi:FMN phosphatase YigB (HAD superfamily)
MVYVGNKEKDAVGASRAGMISCLIARNKEFSNWG